MVSHIMWQNMESKVAVHYFDFLKAYAKMANWKYHQFSSRKDGRVAIVASHKDDTLISF